MKGYVQVYTGDGKGKTTAALGLSLRAAGAKLKVFIAQFVKGMEYSELKSVERYADQITLKQYGRGCFIRNEPAEEDIRLAYDPHICYVIVSLSDEKEDVKSFTIKNGIVEQEEFLVK